MNTLHELFEQSSDAVFGIDANGKVRYLNNGCEKLLAISRREAEGRKCSDLLCGRDLQDRKVCGDHCPIPETARHRNPVTRDFDLVVRRANGESLLVNVGTCHVPPRWRDTNGGITTFFSLRQVSCQRLLQRLHCESVHPATAAEKAGNYNLTARETEVLELAANGLKTEQIAECLSISKVTVGNHFKSIYPKIGVHSRAEAVSFALRHHLVRRRQP